MLAITRRAATTAVVAMLALPLVGATAQADSAPSTTPRSGTATAAEMTREARVFGATAMRDSAEDRGAVLRVIPANSFVVMDDAAAPSADWLRVIVDGRVGFVPKKYAEGPWLGKRVPGDTTVRSVPADVQKKIIDLNL